MTKLPEISEIFNYRSPGTGISGFQGRTEWEKILDVWKEPSLSLVNLFFVTVRLSFKRIWLGFSINDTGNTDLFIHVALDYQMPSANCKQYIIVAPSPQRRKDEVTELEVIKLLKDFSEL